MDKRVQRYLAIIFVLVNYLGYAQCKSNRIERVTEDECEYIIMSKEKFTHYYLADKNLRIIEDSLPNVRRALKKKEEATILLKENSGKLDSLAKAQNKALEFCYSNLADVELANIELAKSQLFYKRTTIGAIALFITTLLILK